MLLSIYMAGIPQIFYPLSTWLWHVYHTEASVEAREMEKWSIVPKEFKIFIDYSWIYKVLRVIQGSVAQLFWNGLHSTLKSGLALNNWDLPLRISHAKDYKLHETIKLTWLSTTSPHYSHWFISTEIAMLSKELDWKIPNLTTGQQSETLRRIYSSCVLQCMKNNP